MLRIPCTHRRHGGIDVFYCPTVFPADDDLPLAPLLLLDQIQDQHRRPISLQKIREVILPNITKNDKIGFETLKKY